MPSLKMQKQKECRGGNKDEKTLYFNRLEFTKKLNPCVSMKNNGRDCPRMEQINFSRGKVEAKERKEKKFSKDILQPVLIGNR